MSSKQAKRERKAQRLRGEVPHLDAKRAERIAQYEKDQRMREENERFRHEHPEEFAERAREASEKMRTLIGVLGTVMGGF
jgi:hypothetical protein